MRCMIYLGPFKEIVIACIIIIIFFNAFKSLFWTAKLSHTFLTCFTARVVLLTQMWGLMKIQLLHLRFTSKEKISVDSEALSFMHKPTFKQQQQQQQKTYP